MYLLNKKNLHWLITSLESTFLFDSTDASLWKSEFWSGGGGSPARSKCLSSMVALWVTISGTTHYHLITWHSEPQTTQRYASDTISWLNDWWLHSLTDDRRALPPHTSAPGGTLPQLPRTFLWRIHVCTTSSFINRALFSYLWLTIVDYVT